MFRSSENLNIDHALDMCKEMVEDIDDCLKAVQRLNAHYDSYEPQYINLADDDAAVAPIEEEDEDDDEDEDENEEEEDEEADLPEGTVVVTEKNQIKPSKTEGMELIFEHKKGLDLKGIEEELKILELEEPESKEEGRTYNEVEKVYKDLSVKCIKLRRDLESSATQLMHIAYMADRTKDIAQLIAKCW